MVVYVFLVASVFNNSIVTVGHCDLLRRLGIVRQSRDRLGRSFPLYCVKRKSNLVLCVASAKRLSVVSLSTQHDHCSNKLSLYTG